MPERPPDDRAEPVRDIRDRHAEPAENERQDEPRIAHGNERQVIEKLFRIFRPERLICTGELAEERKRDDSISSQNEPPNLLKPSTSAGVTKQMRLKRASRIAQQIR